MFDLVFQYNTSFIAYRFT